MHTHEHEHTHEHNHTRTHDHDSSGHTHSHGGQNTDEKETYALIKYMLSHNIHHAGELRELSAKLEAAGKPEAALLIAKAVEFFEKGNLELEKAVSLID